MASAIDNAMQQAQEALARYSPTNLDEHETDILLHDVAAFYVRLDADRRAGQERPLATALAREAAQCEDYCNRLQAWVDGEKRRKQRALNHLMWVNRADVETEVLQGAQENNQKSINTPYGRCGHKRNPSRMSVEVTDEQLALRHAAKSCPDAVRRTEHILKSVLKTHLEVTGELLPGTERVETAASTTFYVGSYKFKAPEQLPEIAEPAQSPKQFAEHFLNPTKDQT